MLPERLSSNSAPNKSSGRQYRSSGGAFARLLRRGTGEDWSEVEAAEIASLMGLPHARYILGDYNGEPVVVTPSFMQGPQSTLILGNTLLMQVDPTYNVGTVRYRQNTHTVDLIITLLEHAAIATPRDCPDSDALRTAADVFVGYLALDVLIGNTDRHHENWGLVVEWEMNQALVRLAPTYDHASSLGCHERDAEKERRLQSRDRNFDCAAYAARARSAFFLEPTDPKPMSTLDAFTKAARRHPGAAKSSPF